MRKAICHQRSAISQQSFAASRAFTLTELMIAVAVLIVVIIATSKIFGTASKITSLGAATASVMTEAATIERMMRDDLSKLTTEGFFAIRCVEVRNDVNVAAGGPLLNPNRLATDLIRADQLVFFANGVNSMQTFRPSANAIVRAQGVAARLYWGHAFQLRNGSPADVIAFNNIRAHDPLPIPFSATNPFPPPTPWFRGGADTNPNMQWNLYGTFNGTGTSGSGTDMFGPQVGINPTNIRRFQPDARQWLLSRQPVILIDDDETERFRNSKTVVFTDHVTARSIFIQGNAAVAPWGWSREIRNGRLDTAASQLDDIRKWVMYNKADFDPAPTNRRVWVTLPPAPTDQRTIIQGAVYYPRAERRAPSASRIDQALTNHVIGTACSSFAIDWTYDDGIGDATNDAGTFFPGIRIRKDIEQPWFGLVDNARGVMNYSQWPWSTNDGAAATTILPINAFPNNIESATLTPPPGVRDYWAVFGYNQTEPIDKRPFDFAGSTNPNYDLPWATTGQDNNAYTPFPSAIRVTMTLHDPEGKLEGGREVQFVIRLPKRNQ